MEGGVRESIIPPLGPPQHPNAVDCANEMNAIGSEQMNRSRVISLVWEHLMRDTKCPGERKPQYAQTPVLVTINIKKNYGMRNINPIVAAV